MPFPHHDRYWTTTLSFLRDHHREGDTLLAPDEFAEHFPVVHTYVASHDLARPIDPWLVLHKGLLDRVHPGYLRGVRRSHRAVFANEVFMVLSQRDEISVIDASCPHRRSFDSLADAAAEKPALPIQGRILARPPIWTLSTDEIRAEMNERYRSQSADDFGGYEHDHLWDRVRYREIDETFRRLLGPMNGRSVLDMACGLGRSVELMAGCSRYLGIDLSDVAIERSRARFAGQSGIEFRQMDACRLDLPDGSFDVVCAMEVIEHVHDASALIVEAHRVLVPGGLLVINSVNRDSLHLRMTRKLGLPEFKATIEHVREFSFSEMCEMLTRAGFQIGESRGSFLLPYYGIPEVDRHVRHLTNDDPEVVEILRLLGERAGAEFGYEFIVAGHKPR